MKASILLMEGFSPSLSSCMLSLVGPFHPCSQHRIVASKTGRTLGKTIFCDLVAGLKAGGPKTFHAFGQENQ